MIESCASRHSAVSAFTETVEFLERSLASMLMRYMYCCSMIGCLFFLDIIGSQKRIATYNFHILSYHITDRLLAAGNNRHILNVWHIYLIFNHVSTLKYRATENSMLHFDVYLQLSNVLRNPIQPLNNVGPTHYYILIGEY